MQSSDIDKFKESYKKYLTIFYILCIVLLSAFCLPFVTVYLFFKPIKKGGKK